MKTFEVCDLPVRAAKFVARKNWVVTGAVSCSMSLKSHFLIWSILCKLVAEFGFLICFVNVMFLLSFFFFNRAPIGSSGSS